MNEEIMKTFESLESDIRKLRQQFLKTIGDPLDKALDKPANGVEPFETALERLGQKGVVETLLAKDLGGYKDLIQNIGNSKFPWTEKQMSVISKTWFHKMMKGS